MAVWSVLEIGKEKTMENNTDIQQKQNAQEDINNPFDLIKVNYHDFALKQLQECSSEKLKRPIIRKIPDDVDKKSINNDLIEYNDSTFEFNAVGKGEKAFVINRALNGIIDKVTKFKSFANNKTDKCGKAIIEVQVKTDKGTLTSPFILDSKAKCKFTDFAETLCNASNYLIASGDDNTVKLFREKINEKCNDTVTLLSNPGSIEYENLSGRIYKNCYTDGYNHKWANKDGVILLPNGKKVMLDNTTGSNLPELFENYEQDYDATTCATNLLMSIGTAFNNRIEPFLALGLGVMGIFTEKFWKNTCGFPTGFLYGKSKQGKGTIQNLINYIYGFDKTFLAMGNSTYRSINRKCNAYNSCIIHLNDMTSKAIRSEGFENNIVQSYENVVREKMQDGNKFNNLPQCSAMFVSSNYLPVQKEKMLNRILPIYFEPNMYNPQAMLNYYKEPRYLSILLPELLKRNFDDVLEMVNETSSMLAKALGVEVSRESHNVAIAYTGLTFLESLGYYTIEDKWKNVVEYFEWYLNQFREIEEPIDAFLNHLHVLVEEHMLEFEEHLMLQKRPGGELILTIRTQACLDKFNSYIGRIYGDKFIQPKEFSLSVKASPYYIETKNTRFKPSSQRIPPVASSISLNVTEYQNIYLLEMLQRKHQEQKLMLKQNGICKD